MAWFIFDLDDTLLITSAIYEKARKEFAQTLIDAGVEQSPEEIIQLLNKIDWENRKTLDVSKERLVISMFQTYCILMNRHGLKVEDEARDVFAAIMQKVYNHRYRLVWSARKVLTEMKNRGHRLILYTRGDEDLQKRKIKEARLNEFFERIFIVSRKSVQQLETILHSVGIQPEEAWGVGDEILTDVEHSLTLGMKVIRVWGYHEHEPATLPESDRLHNIKSLVHILPLLDQIEQIEKKGEAR
ncbi:HAD family hydrolase [Paenactinomyces guangxiensis]|uniref:HAD hydrolase-like protein n=1 Tax=Paenactinomyces guangxiensis TaxID=1490290 RepID=A0A7W1WN52_9BACL|nr:HAD hydrolase-like protein [Paenactinomyces guangxiensis]MBA4492985.1 HAD hydrolase-like protein [Paenactinomyces guangxiensis]MBH8590166.1 HAD hydrolase-like protein [Paenactinomyces guangxiensis]